MKFLKTASLTFAFLMLSVYLITSASAQNFIEFNLGNGFQQNTCIELQASCATCTFMNVTTVIYPNSTQALGNSAMTKIGTQFNKTFCATDAIGVYTYWVVGNPTTGNPSAGVTFEVSPTGKFFTLVEGLFYIVILITLISITWFLFMRFSRSETPGARAGFGVTTHLMFLITVFLIYRLSVDYISLLSYLGPFIFWFFITVLVTFAITILVAVGYLVVAQINQVRKNELIKRGHSEESAIARMKRR